MTLFSYVVARDYGFAPNPFYGVCTLATCKPNIRSVAVVGDWIIGTGGADNRLSGRLVFAMQVAEKLSFDEYWSDPRFALKKPRLNGSLKQAYGDNIYHRGTGGEWMQEKSHHSLPSGAPNPLNVNQDTKADAVLIGFKFVYWGGSGPSIPAQFRKGGADLCAGRNHKSKWPGGFAQSVIDWIEQAGYWGYQARPKQFRPL